MAAQHTIRNGEVLIVADKSRLVGSKYDLDVVGRQNSIALEKDVPMIVGALEGADIASRSNGVHIVEGDTGIVPVRFKAEDSAGRDAFLGRKREPSLKAKIEDLVRNEGLGLVAPTVLRLIEEGGMTREDAVTWGLEQLDLALRSGSAGAEPWKAKAEKLLAS